MKKRPDIKMEYLNSKTRKAVEEMYDRLALEDYINQSIKQFSKITKDLGREINAFNKKYKRKYKYDHSDN